MARRLLSIIAILAAMIVLTANAPAPSRWAVWKLDTVSPGQVSVARAGVLTPPWYVDSIWYADLSGAWKKACWLVRNGDLYGRRYSSHEMNTGQVVCDLNCNCNT